MKGVSLPSTSIPIPHQSKWGALFALFSVCAAHAFAQKAITWPADGVAVSEIEKWTGYNSAVHIDPLKANPALEKQVDEMEARLRTGLPAYLGKIKTVTRNPENIERGTGTHFSDRRFPCLACWQIIGQNGHAIAVLEPEGGIKLNITPNAGHPLMPDNTVRSGVTAVARELLDKFWGGEPESPAEAGSEFPTNLHWRGVDGKTDDPETSIYFAFNYYNSYGTHAGVEQEFWLETGVSYSKWKTLTEDKIVDKSKWLTKREAIASAILNCGEPFHWIPGIQGQLPISYHVASVLDAHREQSGWEVEIILEKGRSRKILYYTVSDKRTAQSSSLNDPPPNAEREIIASAEDIRKWPEYLAVEKMNTLFLAKAEGAKVLAARACSVISPELKDDVKDATIRREREAAGSIRGHSTDFSFIVENSIPRLTVVTANIKQTVSTPALQNHKAWTEFATSKCEQLFGFPPGKLIAYEPELAMPTGSLPGQKSSWELLWYFSSGGKKFDSGQRFEIEMDSNSYSVYWSNPISPDTLEMQLQKMGTEKVDFAQKKAAFAAVRIAHLYAPDIPIKHWIVTDVDFDESFDWTDLTTKPKAVWHIVIQQGAKTSLIGGGSYIDLVFDAESYKVNRFDILVPPII
ncbi:MAG: hypothetical protein QM796_13415 [Chthoniobacteraceae bacterium]